MRLSAYKLRAARTCAIRRKGSSRRFGGALRFEAASPFRTAPANQWRRFGRCLGGRSDEGNAEREADPRTFPAIPGRHGSRHVRVRMIGGVSFFDRSRTPGARTCARRNRGKQIQSDEIGPPRHEFGTWGIGTCDALTVWPPQAKTLSTVGGHGKNKRFDDHVKG